MFEEKSDKAVLDKSAALAPLASASPVEREEILRPPTDSGETVAEAIDAGDEDIMAKLCPMCGWHQDNQEVVEVDKKDKTAFVVAALGGGRYSKTYPLYDGKMTVVMRSRTYAETEMVSEQLERWRRQTDSQSASMVWIKTWTYNMIIGLESVQVGDKDPVMYPEVSTKMPMPPEEGEDATLSPLELGEEQLLADWNEMQYSVIQGVSRHFDQVVQHLTLRAHDSDFWKETVTPA